MRALPNRIEAASTLPDDCLPASVRELVDVIGLAAALAIVEARGGIRLCVPKMAAPDHWLAQAIGMHALRALVAYYGGEEIEIAKCAAAMQRLREQEIDAAAQQGETNTTLARRYGYTERGIRKLRRRVEAQRDDDQPDLFAADE